MKRLAVWGFALVLVGGCGPSEVIGSGKGDGGNNNGNQDGGNGGSDGGGGGGGTDLLGCSGLQCIVAHDCQGGAKTTLTGKVYAPNGTLPLYNATVFVPNGPLEEFTEGVICDRCDGTVTGNPVAIALTGPDGSFTLTDVPHGTNIPLVIQLGRWRRVTSIDAVTACATESIASAKTRLPQNQSEGHIPAMAIASGDADPFECLLLKIGLDEDEITRPTGTGRVHFYKGTDNPGLDLTPAAPRATELYASLASLKKYDVVLLPCEGGEYNKGRDDGDNLDPDPRPLLAQYVNDGGRVFATHYSYTWLTYNNSPFNKVATPLDNGRWPVGQNDDYNNTIAALLVQTFPKGVDFAAWLGFAGATSAPGTLDIAEGRHDVTGVDPKYAQAWATFDFTPFDSGPGVMHFTFNTPLDAPLDTMGNPEYCGRVVFSDFHVTTNELVKDATIFPAACKGNPLTDQEKALAFMLFDLSACVQADSQEPIP